MGGGVATSCRGGRATSAAEASLKTGHQGVVAGELGWVAKGEMVPQFEEALFRLKKGELTAAGRRRRVAT